MTARPRMPLLALCLFMVLGNAAVQVVTQWSALDNEPVNAYASTSSDAHDYIGKAERLSQAGFAEAFGDGYRMPGYPLFLWGLTIVSDTPLLLARWIQIGLSSLVILLAYLALVPLLGSEVRAAAGAAAITLWPPLYHFSGILMAESGSIFLVALLVLALSRTGLAGRPAVLWALPVLVALLVYWKPNHVLLLLPVAAFLVVDGTGPLWRRALRAASIVVMCVLLLAPWGIFLSVRNGRAIPLSTTSGINLLLGSGLAVDPADPSSAGTVHVWAGRVLRLGDEAAFARVRMEVEASGAAGRDAAYAAAAAAAWKARPFRTTLYGVAKTMHSYGFSLRGPKDIAQMALLVAALACALLLWRAGSNRAWCAFIWGVTLVNSLQAFVYLPNQRFTVTTFHLPALVTIVLGFFLLMDRRRTLGEGGT